MGFSGSEARGINANGEVVGFVASCHVRGCLIERPFVWDDHEGMRLLNTPPGHYGANGINNRDEVVGARFLCGHFCEATQAVLYRNGETIDLNSRIPANSEWQLLEATGVDNRGQIVGIGLRNGVRHAFLLTPVSTRGGLPQDRSM
jgi:uncharacterized membrane protein